MEVLSKGTQDAECNANSSSLVNIEIQGIAHEFHETYANLKLCPEMYSLVEDFSPSITAKNF